MLRFGKTAARKDAVKLKFADVFKASTLPTPPASFGHQNLMADGNWHMLDNDQYGDCVFAGAAHEHMLWTMEGGTPRSRFTSVDVLSDYTAVTGFDPTKPATDQGTDMQVAAAYRQTTGIRDALGLRHRIDAYAALRVGDINQITIAAYLFGAIGIGVNCPSSMEQQFIQGKPWDVINSDTIDGGHYIPLVGKNNNGNFLFITWGKVQEATPAWVEAFMDEGICYMDLELVNANTKISPEGFNQDALSGYLKEVS